jgi:hypothetical protein
VVARIARSITPPPMPAAAVIKEVAPAEKTRKSVSSIFSKMGIRDELSYLFFTE